MKKILVCLVAALLFSVSASAQTGALTAITFQFQQNAIPVPGLTTTIVLPGGALCNQPQFPGGPGVPFIDQTAKANWPDPVNANMLCIVTFTPGASIFTLPLGTGYTATAAFTNDFMTQGPFSSPSNPFTRGPAPPVLAIASFAPTTGTYGAAVLLTGTAFTGATIVRFNGLLATFVVTSASTITATVPTGATTGPISVTTPAGTATTATNFTVTVPPAPPAPVGVQVRP